MKSLYSVRMNSIIEDGMKPEEFRAGLNLLLAGDLALRGERGAFRPPDNGDDNIGEEFVEAGPRPNFDPSGLGGVALNEGRFDRDMYLAA